MPNSSTNEQGPASHVALTSQQWWALTWVMSITSLVAGILAVIFYGVLPEEGTWARYPESVEGLCEQFCESSHRCHLTMAERPPIFQPVDAWTGLAFLMVGLWPLVNRVDLPTIAFFFGNVYVGIGSFMFHASLAEFWGDIDVAGMIALLSATACHGVHAVFGISWTWMFPPIVVLSLCTNFFYPQIKSIGLIVDRQMYCLIAIMAFSTLRLVVARIRQMPKTDAKTATFQPPKWLSILQLVLFASFPGILFSSAFGIWLLENAKVLCNPSSLLQGHSFWHILSAISVLMNWQFLDQNRLVDIQCTEAGVEQDEVLDPTDEVSEEDIFSDLQFGLSSRHSTVCKEDVELGLTSDDSSVGGSEASFAVVANGEVSV